MADRGTCSKWFPLLIYEEYYEMVKSALETIGYKYAMQKHDKDQNEDGTYKKLHWHVVVICERREFQNTLAKRLGIDARFVQYPLASEPNGAIRYLSHLDDPDKAQYNVEDIETNISNTELERLHQKAVKKSKDEEQENLLDDIERLARKTMSYKDFFRSHPGFIYQASSLMKLVTIASDIQWDARVDENTGEFS